MIKKMGDSGGWRTRQEVNGNRKTENKKMKDEYLYTTESLYICCEAVTAH